MNQIDMWNAGKFLKIYIRMRVVQKNNMQNLWHEEIADQGLSVRKHVRSAATEIWKTDVGWFVVWGFNASLRQ